MLQKDFSVVGNVLEVSFLKDDEGKPKGCGFIQLTSKESAEKVWKLRHQNKTKIMLLL